MSKEYTELQLRAKEAGIKSWWIKLAATLEAELAELEAPEKITEVSVAPCFPEPKTDPIPPKVEPISPPKPPTDPMKLIGLLNGRTWNKAMMSIKCLANKSDLWEYRELIKEEYAKTLAEK